MAIFRVTRGQRVDLTEGLEIIQRELVSHEVEENILKGATASSLVAAPQMAQMYLRVAGIYGH